jgi:hypothetical protein
MRALIPGVPVNSLKDLTDIKSVGCVGPRLGGGKPRRIAPGLPFVSCGMQGAETAMKSPERAGSRQRGVESAKRQAYQSDPHPTQIQLIVG